jgi:hypothetical protein
MPEEIDAMTGGSHAAAIGLCISNSGIGGEELGVSGNSSKVIFGTADAKTLSFWAREIESRLPFLCKDLMLGA